MVIGVSNVANVGVNCGRDSASERDLITVLASGGDLDTHQTAYDRSDQPRSQLSVWYTP
jgi:hypothetical protein